MFWKTFVHITYLHRGSNISLLYTFCEIVPQSDCALLFLLYQITQGSAKVPTPVSDREGEFIHHGITAYQACINVTVMSEMTLNLSSLQCVSFRYLVHVATLFYKSPPNRQLLLAIKYKLNLWFHFTLHYKAHVTRTIQSPASVTTSLILWHHSLSGQTSEVSLVIVPLLAGKVFPHTSEGVTPTFRWSGWCLTYSAVGCVARFTSSKRLLLTKTSSIGPCNLFWRI